MRSLRLASVVLLMAGCFGPSERQRRGGAGPTGGTGGSSTAEPDAAVGGTGGEDTGGEGGAPSLDAGQGDTGRDVGQGDTGRDVGPNPSDAGRDVARDVAGSDLTARDLASADTASPRDAAVDAARDLAADLAAPSPDTAAGDPEPGRLAGITRFHNQVRATIPVPALTWDPAVAATAAAYAAECKFEHSETQGVGENLAAYAPPGGRSAKSPVDDWAGEKAHYDYDSNSCASGEVCGHYTQLVWKTSLRLGCAVQACTQNSPFGASTPNWEIWVCQYAPPGNIVGRKPY